MRIKIIRQLLSGITLILVFTYGLGSYFGWWDIISGRKDARYALRRLEISEGWPSIVIRTNDSLYLPTEKIIEQNTKNVEVRSLGQNPSGICRMGDKQFVLQPGNMLPTNWPAVASAPSWACIVFLYGDVEKPGASVAWVGTLGELGEWIERSKSREQFWVTVIVTTVLSLSVFLLQFAEKR